MKRWYLTLAIVLVVLSALTYTLHYLVFEDLHHILIFALGDLAFVFIEVLLVTLIIHELLERRERMVRLSKLNMVIGAFYSEVGMELIKMINGMQCEPESACRDVKVGKAWTHKDFAETIERLRSRKGVVKVEPNGLREMRDFLSKRRDFLLRLMENPNLLEHERFTELLLAVFHITDELVAREDFDRLPATDLAHLGGDAQRAYSRLIVEWVLYLEYLQKAYPYLFSLAIRENPLDAAASPVVID
ncbi:MAG: hypothetical protein LUQ16_09045 [Methanomassiliicoccales archaeon]|nr:hypothetical protein [Methanomassiliicoccales archaeon]MDD1756160.1 hypothetical protein [Methanomassiliicoccales archaeon]